ncbi:Excinuclease ABC, C subunit-like [hydrothermal vent metagenome]|uniref:Excinuclease ABC, C subunit-like n=1 Tax=hydrothermal vent metagenome TaxID=652676 RepID=A0A3B1D211_9ZZZZ
MSRNYYIYCLTNWNNKVMYIGVTNNLERRIYEHKNKLLEGFTKKYNLNKLVYFEETRDIHAAISREKEIKKWRREKKDALVKQLNPDWEDLAKDFSLGSK